MTAGVADRVKDSIIGRELVLEKGGQIVEGSSMWILKSPGIRTGLILGKVAISQEQNSQETSGGGP